MDLEIGRRVIETGYELGPRPHFTLLSQGRLNLTFLVETIDRKYILQRLHPIFGSDGAVVENSAAVADVLDAAGLMSPRVIPARNGRKWVEDQGIWRLSLWLPGNIVSRRGLQSAREAARILGRFHLALADASPALKELPPAEYKWESPPGPDDWETLLRIRKNDPKYQKVEPVLQKALALARKLPRFSPSTTCIIHGDPKLENILFSEQGQALALIDLDTVRTGKLFWELADAIRSWAAVSSAGNHKAFDLRIFEASILSYKTNGLPLTRGEWSQLIPGVQAVTLNLAWRYLKDYFEEAYFTWDQANYPSPAEQNLCRGAEYVRMVEVISTSSPGP